MNISTRLLFISTLLTSSISVVAQDDSATAQGGGIMSVLPMMLIMFVIIFFFMIRPEQKKQKARAELLKNIKKGDKVLTAGGIIGIVGNIKENVVMVKIANDTVVEFSKSAVTNVINGDEAEKTTIKEEKKK